jgi:hypothetical protein
MSMPNFGVRCSCESNPCKFRKLHFKFDRINFGLNVARSVSTGKHTSTTKLLGLISLLRISVTATSLLLVTEGLFSMSKTGSFRPYGFQDHIYLAMPYVCPGVHFTLSCYAD